MYQVNEFSERHCMMGSLVDLIFIEARSVRGLCGVVYMHASKENNLKEIYCYILSTF